MPFRILSLDGGGIRGIVTAQILSLIEKQIDQPLNEYFDLIAGTSTGSILAAAIATGIRSEKIVEFYRENSSLIFPY
ncbi:MAG: patatin-like phospholipase family protein, partial [Cyanobacteria bacterium J06639_18]